MSIAKKLQTDAKYGYMPSNANVTIKTKDGNSNINVSAKNVDINTGSGDQNITVIATGDLTIDTGKYGTDNILAYVNGDAEIATKKGDDTINLYVNGEFTIDSGSTSPACVNGSGKNSDNDIVLVHGNLNATDQENYVATGNGNDNVRIIANNVDVEKANGNFVLGFYGDNYDVNSDASNNKIGFWGDDVNININGQGSQDIKTLDFSFAEGSFLDFGFENLLAQDTYAGSSYDTIVTERLTGKDNLDEVAKKYNLTDAQVKQLRELDLTKETSNGKPYYLLYKDGNSYYIGYRDSNDNLYNLAGKKLNYNTSSTHTQTSGNYARSVTTTNTAALTGSVDLDVEREREITTETIKNDFYNIDGVKNVKINFNENGKYNVGITAEDGYVEINGQDACNNDIVQNIIVRGGYVATARDYDKDVSYVMDKLELGAGNLTKTSNTTYGGWYALYDPLVLDTNKDGVVSTKKTNTGFGVDVDGDGVNDGAATGGDKMLAMSDLNKNGKIDGTEIFGNYTVSPFTKKALNASNGFEALKMIALEAKEYEGVDCMEGDYVNVQKLAQVLAKYNIKLGLISDDNTKALESLNDIQAINVNYRSIKDNGDAVQHKQQSTYKTTDGKSYKVDDVWF